MLKSLKPFVALALLSAASVTYAGSFDHCLDYFPDQFVPKPQASVPGKDLCFDSFAVFYSFDSKTPLYTVEKLNRDRILHTKGEKRTNKFYEEARLPSSVRATLDDYKGSGYDRGHNSPAGDMPNDEAMAQSFSLANMMPQVPANNRGVWAKAVEIPTRKYALRASGNVYVFTGSVYGAKHASIGRNKVWVPDYLYKLVYDQDRNKTWAYWVPNADVNKPDLISYDELVKRTGIQFLKQPH